MDKYDILYYKIKGEARRLVHLIRLRMNPNRNLLKRNIELKNKYEGKRCFVVGNGPSLSHMNLSLLKNEYIFTVNYIMKSDLYNQITSSFHVIVDPFEFLDDGNQIIEIQKINKNGYKPICFMPLAFHDQIVNKGIDKIVNIRYICGGLNFYDGFRRNIDLTSISPSFANVVLYSAMIAVYLGFKEIIFIGCDMTGYEQLSVIAGKDVKLHPYEMDEKEKENIIRTHQMISNEDFFMGFENTFAQFRIFNEYANKCGIRLINATKGGVLNSIQRVEFESLFNL